MRRKLGREKPSIKWLYILFEWNDSDEEMNRAREIGREIGVDQVGWLITQIPEDGYSRRFVPGSPDYESIKDELL